MLKSKAKKYILKLCRKKKPKRIELSIYHPEMNYNDHHELANLSWRKHFNVDLLF